jgi:K+-transporting ATPase KdpF subunit
MTALYVIAGIVVVALAGYLIVALIKPELFP